MRRRAPAAVDDREFWALRDVSFDVRQGEVMGVIGRNGAGKSTLLKILSRITDPTHGRAVMRGRVASLLEVGTGFHRELTGRENIYLSGALLGMSKTEIDRRFDEIVAFAEIERFTETPVKRYSSGMYTRLAFAVAAHLEPEILLVDEVLAVGDASFQRRCLGKMGEVARGGRTILFVSHNMAAVAELCGRSVLLDGGRVVKIDRTPEVIARYLCTAGEETRWHYRADEQGGTPEEEAVRLVEAELIGARSSAPGLDRLEAGPTTIRLGRLEASPTTLRSDRLEAGSTTIRRCGSGSECAGTAFHRRDAGATPTGGRDVRPPNSGAPPADGMTGSAGPAGQVLFGEPFAVRMRWRHERDAVGAAYAMLIHDASGRLVIAVNTLGNPNLGLDGRGEHEVTCRLPQNVLVPGEYSVSLSAWVRPSRKLSEVEGCLRFAVSEVPYRESHRFTVVSRPLVAVESHWERA